MRVLIISAAVLAFASAAPSGAYLGSYGLLPAVAHAAPLAVAHAAPLAVAHAAPVIAHAAIAPAVPTISSGDIQGAAIDAHVDAADHARAAIDQASEIHGQHVNAAEDHSWQAIDAVKTAEAQLDGAAAAAAPVIAKSLVSPVVAVAHAAPVIAPAAPVAYAAAAPVAYAAAAPVVAHAAPLAYAHAAPVAVAHSSQSIVKQSLTQTHPSPAVALSYAAPLAHHAVHAW